MRGLAASARVKGGLAKWAATSRLPDRSAAVAEGWARADCVVVELVPVVGAELLGDGHLEDDGLKADLGVGDGDLVAGLEVGKGGEVGAVGVEDEGAGAEAGDADDFGAGAAAL